MMPALSPTMTEGNIAKWQVKEGDSFAVGDVLLEIETDKATMDVEAQDDGIMVKISKPDGSKNVAVGTRIAVTAEQGDDIKTLEIPPEPKPQSTSTSTEKKKTETTNTDGDNSKKAKAGTTTSSTDNNSESGSNTSQKASKRESGVTQDSDSVAASDQSASSRNSAEPQTYPLFPSVEQLVKEKGLGKSDIAKMTPTGPKARLVKGDVLAYLGTIPKSRPSEIKSRFDKLSHLDLSNVKLAPASQAAADKAAGQKPAVGKDGKPIVATASGEQAMDEPTIEIVMPISLSPALDAARLLKRRLGIELHLLELVQRAAALANRNLPPVTGKKQRQPSPDKLFDEILGLAPASDSTGVCMTATASGNYLPHFSPTVPPQARKVLSPQRQQQQQLDDAFDFLVDAAAMVAPKKPKALSQPNVLFDAPAAVASRIGYFSLKVPEDEKKRAHVFLERMKVALESEPARLMVSAPDLSHVGAGTATIISNSYTSR